MIALMNWFIAAKPAVGTEAPGSPETWLRPPGVDRPNANGMLPVVLK
jgi:hypothetical protein